MDGKNIRMRWRENEFVNEIKEEKVRLQSKKEMLQS